METTSSRTQFADSSIERLVRTFYARVQDDAFLAPVFQRRITDWEPHLRRMIAFWTTVLRGEAAYFPGPKGSPPAIHQGIEELTRAHFERWLALFAEVASEVFPPSEAAFVVERSQRMGRALSAHLAPVNS